MFINSPYELFLKEEKFIPYAHFGDINNPSQRYFISQEVETLFVRCWPGLRPWKETGPHSSSQARRWEQVQPLPLTALPWRAVSFQPCCSLMGPKPEQRHWGLSERNLSCQGKSNAELRNDSRTMGKSHCAVINHENREVCPLMSAVNSIQQGGLVFLLPPSHRSQHLHRQVDGGIGGGEDKALPKVKFPYFLRKSISLMRGSTLLLNEGQCGNI